jgi:hypothetical protein
MRCLMLTIRGEHIYQETLISTRCIGSEIQNILEQIIIGHKEFGEAFLVRYTVIAAVRHMN